MSNSKPFTTHNGVQIFLTPAGSFSAEINGNNENRPSVAALKKLIEKKATFAPFKAIEESRGYKDRKGEIRELTITGAKKNNKSRSWSNNVWIDASGNSHSTIIPDTPENRAVMQAVIDKRFAISEIETQLEIELQALERNLTRRNLDKELAAAETAKTLKANGSDALEVGTVYKIDHSRKGKFVAKLLKINGEFADVEIVDGTAHMLSAWNEDGEPGDVLALRTDLAKWERVQ